MEWLMLIWALLLPLFSADGGNDRPVSSGASPYCLSPSPDSQRQEDQALCRDMCITAAQGTSFSGDGGTHSVSVRHPDTGRRTSPQTKSTFRMVKCGKVIDSRHIEPFLTCAVVTLSGPHASDRYLYSICRLRI